MTDTKKTYTRTTAREVIIEAIKDNFLVVDDRYLLNPVKSSDWYPVYHSIDTPLSEYGFTVQLEKVLTAIPGMEHVKLSGCDQLCDILQNNFTD